MKFHTRLLAVTTTAAAVVLGLVAPAGADTPRGPAAPPAATGPDRGHADKLISLVEHDRGIFGGISFDEDTGTATVRYASNAGATAARTRLGAVADQRAGGWRVILRPVQHSLADLDTVRHEVAADPEWRETVGPLLSEWYTDVAHNQVAVGVTALTPEITEAAEQAFGDTVSLHVAPRQQRESRQDDFEPWTAGIRIFFSSGGGCTSGFVIRTVSTPVQRRLVSAGHCGPLGATVTNNGDLVGTVVDRRLDENGLDYSYIGGRAYEPWMYTGSPTSDVGLPIHGSILSGVGLSVCTNGATTGENCTGKVTAIDECVLFSDGITTCFLDRAESTNGSTLTAPGDSGGPVIAYDSSGNLHVVGTIIGGGGPLVYFHSYHYLVPAGWVVDSE
jgi:hypothetical protein